MTMKKCLITAGLVFALNPLVSFAEPAPVEDYSEPVNEIQDGGVSLSNSSQDARPGSLSERLQRVESKVEHLTESNVTARMEELQQTIQELRGELEKQGHALEQLDASQKNFYKDLNSRIAKSKEATQVSQADTEVETVPVTATVKKSSPQEEVISLSTPVKATSAKDTGNAPIKIKAASLVDTAPITAPVKAKHKNSVAAVSEAKEPVSAPKSASNPGPVPSHTKATVATNSSSVEAEASLYQQGFALLKSKQYDRASSQFKDYLKQYPQGRYAANAHFWTGEINYLQGKHVVAKKSFETVVKNYPKDSKIPDAMLKLAIIETDTGHKQKAEEMLQSIQKKYPGTTAARLAMIRSQELRLSMTSSTH